MKTQPSTINPRAQDFINAYNLGLESWREAGRILIKELEDNPNFADEIHALSNGEISVDILEQFKMIGRNMLLPQLMLDWRRPGVSRLMEMPIDVQEKYASSPVDVVVFNSSGSVDILLIHPRNMTQDQVDQVFGRSEVRTQAAQRAWLESNRSKAKSKVAPDVVHSDSYIIKGGTITFTKPCKFTLKQLMKIIVNHKK